MSQSSDTESSSSTETDISELTPKRKSLLKRALVRGDRSKQAILRPYTKFVRWYSRSEDMFLRWEETFNMIIKYDMKKFGQLTETEFVKKHKRGLRAFNMLKSSVKYFNIDWPFLSNNTDNFVYFHKALDAAVGAARSEDIHSIRDDVLLYTALALPEQRLTPEIPPKASKGTSRGHFHIQLSRCICPIKDIGRFDENPEKFNLDLRNGVIKYFAWDLPACLWPYDGFDPDNYDENMLRNPALIRVFKHIFTSPTSAMKDLPGQTKTRSSQAKMNAMESVTAGSIAYTSVMYRYAISSIDDWRNEEKLFIKADFFNHIMVYFDESDDDHDAGWVEDLFEFYDAHIFGKDPRSAQDSDNELRPVPTHETIRQQRRARLALKQQAAQEEQAAAAAALPETQEGFRPSMSPRRYSERRSVNHAQGPYYSRQQDGRSLSPVRGGRQHNTPRARSRSRGRHQSRDSSSYSRVHQSRSRSRGRQQSRSRNRQSYSHSQRPSYSRRRHHRSRSHDSSIHYSSNDNNHEDPQISRHPYGKASKKRLYRRGKRYGPEEYEENGTGSWPKNNDVAQPSPQAPARSPLQSLNHHTGHSRPRSESEYP